MKQRRHTAITLTRRIRMFTGMSRVLNSAQGNTNQENA
jgi:hypothetical protein